ncbi:MAG: YdbL family protein [Chlorobi bacterium]|nr:YdbL family protein [Chlorobiota bacterium]
MIGSFVRSAAAKTIVLLMLSFAAAIPAFALDLVTARAQGLAGEVDNGLLGIPPGAASDAAGLVVTINNQRRAEYAKIAAQNNLSLDVVGTMMFEKIYVRLPAGTWVQVKGQWKKKGG